MAEEATNPETPPLEGELGAALATLESALAEAGRAVAAIRGITPQIAALDELVGEMERTMARARQHSSTPFAAGTHAAAGSPALRPVSLPEAASEPETKADDATGDGSGAKPDSQTSPCLRLDVSSKSGSLDLKAVDGSVNENSAVVDVALLDYDGHHATLKIWIEASADPIAVRDALLESLQRHVADEQGAEVRITFEEKSAAA